VEIIPAQAEHHSGIHRKLFGFGPERCSPSARNRVRNRPEFSSASPRNLVRFAPDSAPIGSFEGHLSYDMKPRLWFSLDGNFWFGGVTSLNGIANLATRQTSSRIGMTAPSR
jgi:hypothetical protein